MRCETAGSIMYRTSVDYAVPSFSTISIHRIMLLVGGSRTGLDLGVAGCQRSPPGSSGSSGSCTRYVVRGTDPEQVLGHPFAPFRTDGPPSYLQYNVYRRTSTVCTSYCTGGTRYDWAGGAVRLLPFNSGAGFVSLVGPFWVAVWGASRFREKSAPPGSSQSDSY